MDLIVIGSSNMDLVISLPRIPRAGETILGGKSSMIFGGKGANQAVTASRCGSHVAFITKLGKDLFGENIKTHFKNEVLPDEFILTDESEPTGIAQIFVSDQGENIIAVAPGANAKLSVQDIIQFESVLLQSKVILLQLEIPIETVDYVIRFAAENKIKVILNPAPAHTLADELLKQVWLLTPNETEAALLTGHGVADLESAQKAADLLLDKGVQNVIITLGENGCLFSNPQGPKHYPAFKLRAIDSTAAGDVFNGALATAITKQMPWNLAIPFANAAAAISVTRYGAQTSIPYLVEVDNFLHSG